MNLHILLCLFTSFILLSCSASSSENEFRNWTDVKGRTMQAKLVEVDLGKNEAVFLKDTGKRYRFRIDQLSEADQEYVHAQKDKLPETIEPVADQRTSFEKDIGKDLVQFSAGRMKQVQEAELSPKDYYAIYYSAHWCPPCRAFTPQLVSFYNSYSRKHDNFEIIFVSSDRSEKKMEDYMKTANMPWPALQFDQKSHPATRYSGSGIPCLVLLDNKGNVLADSYVNGRYVGPTHVMNMLKEKLD